MSDRHTILVVSPYRGEYGPRRVLDHVVRALTMANFRVICATPADAILPESLTTLGVRCTVIDRLGTVPRTLDPRRLARFARDHAAAARQLASLAEEEGACAIYSTSEAILAGAFAARRTGVPAIVHAIGMSIQSPRPVARLYIGLLRRLTTQFIACSSAVADMFGQFGVDDRQISVVHNGISVDEIDAGLASADHELDGTSGVRIGMVAAYDPRKGHQLFLEAAAIAAERLPGAHFYLIGGALEGHSESVAFEQHVVALIHRLELDDRITRTGYVEAPGVYGWIRAMDIIVVPSRTEAFAHALLEAMACGKAIVATGIEGNLDAFVQGHSGLYAEQDPRKLAETMVEFGVDPAKREAFGRAARARVELLFDLSATLPANGQIVAQTLSGYAGTPAGPVRSSTNGSA